MNIAVIPARGGSKRIPRKNIRDFCGKPMIAHAITNALDSGCIDEVVVSTDDPEIAEVAKSYGASVPFMRPPELADDHTGTSPVVRHAIQTLLDNNWSIDYCACIYATSPLLSTQYIREGLDTLMSNKDIAYVFTSERYSFPIQRAIIKTRSGGVVPFDKIGITKRSQDLEPTYHDAGQLYWGHCSTWLNPKKAIFSPESRMIVLPAHLVQDIDTPEDWTRAEMLFKLQQNENQF